MLDLTPEQAAQAASMSPSEWSAHVARYQPPDTAEQLRTVAAQHVSDDQLDSLMGIVDPSKFVGADGHIDAAKVSGHIRTLFGKGESQQPRHWGQSTGQPAGQRAGNAGRAEAARRQGRKVDPAAGAPVGPARPGAGGSAEAARRNHNRKARK